MNDQSPAAANGSNKEVLSGGFDEKLMFQNSAPRRTPGEGELSD